MLALKSLSFTTLTKAGNDPAVLRRARFIEKLEEQKLLLADPNHIRSVQRWATEEGRTQLVTRQQRVRPWWKVDASGQIVMTVKFGSRPIEFEKGKAGIAVSSKDKLPDIIDALIAAMRAGELDDVLSAAARTKPIAKARKAA